MARINSYASDVNIIGSDKVVGTDASTGDTKNYTLTGVSGWMNDSGAVRIVGQANYSFQADGAAPRRPGTLSFDNYLGDGTEFADVTYLNFSKTPNGGYQIEPYLNELIGFKIVIAHLDELENFGLFTLLTIEEFEENFLKVGLRFESGSGILSDEANYGFAPWALEPIEKPSLQEVTDIGATTTLPITTGGLTVDTDTLYVDIVNNRVGIGTLLPDATLTVNKISIGEYANLGSGNAEQLKLSSYNTDTEHAGHKINASSSDGEIVLATADVEAITIKNDQTLQFNAYGIGYLKSDVDGNITFDSDIIEDTLDSVTTRDNVTANAIEIGGLIVDTDTIYVDVPNSNVGIGTTSPSQKLHVSGGNILLDSQYGVRFNDGNTRIYTNDDSPEDLIIEADQDLLLNPDGNVGIGTTSPSQKLHINNAAALTATYQKFTNGTATTGTTLGIDADGDFLINNEEEKEIKLFTNDTQRLTIQSGGNVGIGTTSPVSTWASGFDPSTGDGTFKLTSEGWIVTPYLTGLAAYYPNQGARPIFWADAGGTNIQNWDDNATDGVSIKSHEGTTRLFVRDDGNVGIGTTSPSARLDVSHTIRTTGSATPSSGKGVEIRYLSGDVGSVLSYDRGSSAYTPLRLEGSVITLRESGNSVLTVDGGNVGIGTTSPSGKLHVAGGDIYINASYGLKYSATSYISPENNVSGAEISTPGVFTVKTGTTPAEHLRINTDGSVKLNAYTAGYLKSDASGNITVDSDTIEDTLQSVTDRGNTTTNNLRISNSSPDLFFETGATHYNWMLAAQENVNAGFEISVGSQDADSSDDTWSPKFVVKQSGNVGIGTTAPTHLLTLETESSPGIKIKDTTQGATLLAFSQNSDSHVGTYSSHPLVFDTNSAERMRITSGGNVGIGITAPENKLSIGSTQNGGIDFLYDSSNSYKNQIKNYWNSSADTRMDFNIGRTANVAPVTVMSVGYNSNVGIGTTSPTHPLHVEGFITTNDSSNASGVLIRKAGSTIGFLGQSGGWVGDTSDDLGISGETGKNIRFYTNGSATERMRITSTGNVGIGTTEPAQNLDVKSDANPTIRLTSGKDGTWTADEEMSSIEFYSSDTSGVGASVRSAIRSLAHDNFGSRSELTFSVTGSSADTEAMRIDSNGNVGIGATSPGSTLHVNGTVRFVDSGFAGFEAHNTNGTWESFIGTETGGGGNRYNSSSSQHTFYNNSTAVMRINTSGNVGIGTTSPSTSLHVVKDGSWEVARFEADSYPTATVYSQAAAKYAQLNIYDTRINSEPTMELRADTPHFNIRLDDTGNVLTIRDSGNVGIGTTDPNSKLHVSDTTDISMSAGSDGQFAIEGNGYTGAIALDATAMHIYHNSSNRYLVLGTNETAAITIHKSNQSLDLNAYGSGTFTGTAAYGLAVDSSGNVIETAVQGSPTGGSGTGNYLAKWETATTLTDSPIYDNGNNIGIGTTSPGAKLEVNGDGTNTGGIALREGTNQVHYIYTDGPYQYNNIGSSSPNWRWGQQGADTKMALNNTGLGIGTTSPAKKLEVYSLVNTESSIRIRQASYNFWDLKSPASSTGFAISDVGGERLRITSAGNVGIGTTSPTVKLEVEGSIQANAQGRFKGWYTSGSGLALETGVSGGNGYVLTYNRDTNAYSTTIIESTGIQFAAHSSGKFYFTGGNVGIGTTSPSANLEVIDPVSGNFSGEIKVGGNGSSRRLLLKQDTVLEYLIGASGSATLLKFGTGNGAAERMRITDTGNVGIGTTSPSEKLEVNGNVKADNFIGGNEAGIYTFNDTINASASEDIFSIFNEHGAQAFRVTFVCSTSGYSVAKTYEVVHAFGVDPVFFKVVDTGEFSGHDFDASFATEAGGGSANNRKIICTITNNSTTINADIVTTVFLGGSPTAITVTAL